MTFRDNRQDAYYANSRSAELSYPSNDTRDFLHVASKLLDNIWKDGFRYAKAGVMLSDFYYHGIFKQDLFEAADSMRTNSVLMTVPHQINEHMPNSLYFASKGTKQIWGMTRELLSPPLTTSWDGLPIVR